MKISYLKYPAIKHTPLEKLPEKLIFQKSIEYFDNPVYHFTMFSTNPAERGKQVIMRCFPDIIQRPDRKEKVPSLYIWFLSSNDSGSGYGKAMIEFARNFSKKIGCNGYIHLDADTGLMPYRVPHIFYRKCGMSTANPYEDWCLDKYIVKGKKATYKNFKSMDMFFPPIEHDLALADKLFFKIANIFTKKKK